MKNCFAIAVLVLFGITSGADCLQSERDSFVNNMKAQYKDNSKYKLNDFRVQIVRFDQAGQGEILFSYELAGESQQSSGTQVGYIRYNVINGKCAQTAYSSVEAFPVGY